MSTLTIRQGHLSIIVSFKPPQPLSAVLASSKTLLAQPCGGRGVCGKCAISLSGNISAPNSAEIRCGSRLACQAIVYGDAEVILPASHDMNQIEDGQVKKVSPCSPMNGRFGAAVDIGTTTLVLSLYDLTTGHRLSSASMLNPQTNVAADVIGRIEAALKGRAADLQQQVQSAVLTLLAKACAQSEISPSDVSALTISGNTTMLYLLNGRDSSNLSRAPFHADYLFGSEEPLFHRIAYYPPCLHAFVGADTACAVLSSGMIDRRDTVLLCDVGTNGELALWHQNKLYISSTAAGPAFEGAGISCGCASVIGAIDRVSIVNGRLHCHTIGGEPAVGLCGSGLVDAIAAMLDAELIDDTGYLDKDPCRLQDDVCLVQGDVRAVQLAKSAIHAGIMSLLSAAGCTASDVSKVYIAGGFGSHLNIRSAVRIGLIPAELADKVQLIGNAALDGAAMLLLDTGLREKVKLMQELSHHVRLDSNPEFAERYIESMLFE